MKKALLPLVLASILTVQVFAYDSVPPASSDFGYTAFITLDTSELGEVSIVLPVTWLENSLSWDGSALRNITNSTITGYYGPDTSYDSVRWSAFSGPQYRAESGSYYSWEDLTVLEVVSTNINLVEDWGEVGVTRQMNYYVIFLLIGGVLLLLLFMKKF